MDNIWTRRANKLSLATNNQGQTSSTISSQTGDASNRTIAPFSKRFGGDGGTTINPSKAGSFAAPNSASVVSPTSASNAFGLGSGAFASFGPVSAKTPKAGGNPFEAELGSAVAKPNEKAKEIGYQQGSVIGSGGSNSAQAGILAKRSTAPDTSAATSSILDRNAASGLDLQRHPLRNKWVFWFRPPTSKSQGFVDYEKTLHAMAHCSSIEEFWAVYSHLKRVSTLPQVSEYHFFKWGIRPIWEDEENKKGGKWVVRLKKGVADRYWEDLLFALIGDQFSDAGEEVCGAVVSVRTGEDIISIWTRTDGGRVLKIRETMKHILNFPGNTRVEFKSHDSSIQQRTAIDEQRREKSSHNSSSQHHNNNGSGNGNNNHNHSKNNNSSSSSTGGGLSSGIGGSRAHAHAADQKS
ncbi:Eukaryotic translation initiation factor 4E type2 [Ceratocystis lukuohia]|uniref:Eukaryotic translation initiation factor 4E type2 n=1 Tax=Ceratocystis lukuohia TaxID=2019550 RepID=A0ABR4MHR1_9PEZI